MISNPVTQVRLKDLLFKRSKLTPQEFNALRRWLGDDWRSVQYDQETLDLIEPLIISL